MIELLLLGIIGGVVAVDGVAAVQSMVSRPLVVGWLVGALIGAPLLGAQIGVLLELYLLVAIPSGGGRYPEGGTATIVAVVAAAVVAPAPAAAALGIAGGLVWGWLAGESQNRLRRWNEQRADAPEHPVDARDVARAQALGLGADFLRGAGLTLIGVALARAVAPALAEGWPLSPDGTLAIVVLGALVSLGILLRSVAATRSRAVVFGVGLIAGALLLGGA